MFLLNRMVSFSSLFLFLTIYGCSDFYNPKDVFFREIGFVFSQQPNITLVDEGGVGSDAYYEYEIVLSHDDYIALENRLSEKFSSVKNSEGVVFEWRSSDTEYYAVTMKKNGSIFLQVLLE